MKNILIVDDEKDIADLIELYLTNENYKVHKFYSPEKIMEYLTKNQIDLAILDIMMPKINGYDLCIKIRQKYDFPIIFLTAKTQEIDKIKGLSLGADDYVEKPFRILELMARVKSHLRRYNIYSQNKNINNEIIIREIKINKDKHEIYFGGKKINLTPTEFLIMWYLCKNKGRVVTNDELFKVVWKDKYYEADNNTITVYIRHIREKLNDTGNNPKYIKTIWGVGYEIEK